MFAGYMMGTIFRPIMIQHIVHRIWQALDLLALALLAANPSLLLSCLDMLFEDEA